MLRDYLQNALRYPHLIGFIIRSDDLLDPKYIRSAIGAERPILIPSTYVATVQFTLKVRMLMAE